MAEIFLAKQQGAEGFQKPVVLKRILSTVSADPQFRNMLIDEAHISMSLAHSNIVQVLDLGQAGGRTFLALELVDGWDLSKLLQRARAAGRRLPYGLGMFVATEICRALAYAHAKTHDGKPLGIVHRDVSPNNVLISEQGEVKLADFGIAKALNKRENTGTGVVKGKVAFMSPEQALGKPLDLRSDLFSLGSLLYVLMVGQRPFDAPTDLETLLRVQRADFKNPSGLRPDLEAPIASIIERSMMLEPSDRYQSADEMLVEMERVLRRIFGGIGQTELKMWLVDLGKVDNAPTIANQKGPVDATAPSGEMMEGKAVELGDALVGVDVEGKTSLAVMGGASGGSSGGSSAPRELAGDSWHDAPMELQEGPPAVRNTSGGTHVRTRRRDVEELTLPEGFDGGTEEAPPVRMGGGQKGRSGLWTLLFLAALVGGGYAGVRKFGIPPLVAHWLGMDEGAASAPPATPSNANEAAGAEAAPSPPPTSVAAKKSGTAAPEGVAPKPGTAEIPAKGAPEKAAPDKTVPDKVGAERRGADQGAERSVSEKTRAADREPPDKEPKARVSRPHSAVDEARERVKRLTQSPDYVPPPAGGEAPSVPSPP